MIRRYRTLIISIVVAFIIGIISVARIAGAGGTPVHLRIEGTAATVFDGIVMVNECTVSDDTGIEHTFSGTALCALKTAADDAGFTLSVKDFGFGLFIQQIDTDDTPADFTSSWTLWVNDDPADTGADAYTITADDELLFAFTSFPGTPLRVVAPDQAAVGSDLEIAVQQRSGVYDESFVWHGQWQPAAGAILHTADQQYIVPADGSVHVPNSDSPTAVWADGDGFIRSAQTIIPAVIATPSSNAVSSPSPSPSPLPSPTPTPLASPTPTQSPTPSPKLTPLPTTSPALPSSSIEHDERQERASRALQYLHGQQDSDGTIDGTITTAWSILAFAAADQRASDVTTDDGKSLLDGLQKSTLTSTTDLERHILAIRAAGANPRSFAGTNYVQQLIQHFDGKQFGDANLVNDDIFGILALLAAGEPLDAPGFTQTITTLLASQTADGSWGNLDLTAAAIQALASYRSDGGTVSVSDALAAARDYLIIHRDQYGGWGENSASTAWGIQAVIALGEDPAAWRISEDHNPWTALVRYQHESGAFGWHSSDDTSAFMTAYAATALLETPWPITKLSTVFSSAGGDLVVSPTPSISPSPSPRVASAVSTPVLSSSQPTLISPGAETKEQLRATNGPAVSPATLSPKPIPPAQLSGPITPLTNTDRRFTLGLFTLANVGIGVTIARLLSKISLL